MSFEGDKVNKNQIESKYGVLIVNLGTPDKFNYWPVRRFLNQFLLDNRVVEIPKLIWWPILQLVLLLRTFKTKKLYESIWKEKGSPLMVFSKGLLEKLKATGLENVEYELAMRYGNPSIENGLKNLRKKDCNKIVIIPLFPQYAASTSASIFDEVSRIISKWRWVPSLNFINSYHNEEKYISALSDSIKTKISIHKPQKIIFSFHGIPKRSVIKGDPYPLYCEETINLVAKNLELSDDEYLLTFQSRFGYAEWLKPYTSDVMEELPNEGIKDILVIAPGFSSDCLETIEEIDEENKEIFMEAGGEKFEYVECLNDSDSHVNLIQEIISKEIR